jgi:hypothetical protein
VLIYLAKRSIVANAINECVYVLVWTMELFNNTKKKSMYMKIDRVVNEAVLFAIKRVGLFGGFPRRWQNFHLLSLGTVEPLSKLLSIYSSGGRFRF